MAETRARTTTPLRESSRGREQREGCWILAEGRVDYLDGGEQRLLQAVRSASDLGSLSDELEAKAATWPERYSLSRSRANVLRALNLSPEHTVLEVGAGCGPITRYLGETCGTVDALEPVAERAIVARERTRDLEGVEVYIGGVEDLPAEPAYDVIFVIGVLEYAAGGEADFARYIEFLSRLRTMLKPGGRIVCAIENRLGVKYLAGAPEDHTDRVFDGIEDYPRGGHAHTFTRTGLSTLFEHAGLRAHFYHAFPDYKMTRVVFSDSLLESPEARSLAWRIPWFPSPDPASPRPRLASERRLWQSLVEDGRGESFSNSFLVIAGGDDDDLWDGDQLACFFGTHRRAVFSTETRVVRRDGRLVAARTRPAGPEATAESGGLQMRIADEDIQRGDDFIDVLARSDDAATADWLAKWKRLLEAAGPEAGIDLVPHNIIVGEHGDLVAIDQEWWLDGYDTQAKAERGIFWLGIHIVDRVPPERWPGETVRDVTAHLGHLIGLSADGSWIEGTARHEAEIQARVNLVDPGAAEWDSAVGLFHERLTELLSRRLSTTELGMREHDLRAAAEQEATALHETIIRIDRELREEEQRISDLSEQLAASERQVEGLSAQLREIHGSIGYRLLKLARVPLRFLAPPGSPQRLPFAASRRAVRLVRRRGPLALVSRIVRVHEWPRVIRNLRRAAPPHMDLNAQYQVWLQRNAITPRKAVLLRGEAQALAYRPLISIVTPVYNPDVSWLRDAIESVRGQVYGEWELCLADDASTKPGVRELLADYAARDSRIKVTLAQENGGISAASNAALTLASGEFVGLLDHDDELTPDALFEVARLLNERRDLDYIYSDEDKMETDGSRLDPFFKPDWSPDLLNCLNYVTHFSVYRKSVLDEVGGFRLGFEGSQDWDLTLRVTERTDGIAHIARPLYSWRKVPGSAAASDRAKDYAQDAARKAIAEAMVRRGLKAEVLDGPHRGYNRVKYEITGSPRVAIIIPTRDRADMLRRCIESVRRLSTYANYEIVIINNESREPETLRYFKEFGGRVIDYPHPFNYSAQMNLGVREAEADYAVLLNNDTNVLSRDWIEAMLEYGQRPDVGAVGARLIFPDGRPQHEGVFVGCGDGLAGHLDHGGYFALGQCVRNVSAVTAACMLVKTSAYAEVGGLDEALNVAYNDVDFCLRLREKGYEVIYTPYAELSHAEGGTRGHRHPAENERLFRERWGAYRDPYYNPNFDIDHPFSLKL